MGNIDTAYRQCIGTACSLAFWSPLKMLVYKEGVPETAEIVMAEKWGEEEEEAGN